MSLKFELPKKANYRTMMFGKLVSIMITLASCGTVKNQGKKTPENQAKKDSLFLAEKNNNFLLIQEQNREIQERQIDY